MDEDLAALTGHVDRRQFLLRAAAGTGVFVVPTIISMAPAGAQGMTSPPPEPPRERPSGEVADSGTEQPTPPAETPPAEVDGPVTQPAPNGQPPEEVDGSKPVPPPPAEVAGAVITAQGAQGTQVAGRSELPRTGIDLDDLLVAGLAAAAGGAALVLWSAEADTDPASS